MAYWLDLFTGTTWDEFQRAGAKVTGFRERNWKRAEKIKPGDVFLCYMVGVKRWVGLLEAVGPRYRDESPIWGEEVFPVRFKVKPLVLLKAEYGISMESLDGKLSFFPTGATYRLWSGFLRSSPTKYKDSDGDAISAAIREAQKTPAFQPVDERQLRRSANLYKTSLKHGGKEIETVVSVPTASDEEEDETPDVAVSAPTHTEIQWRLLDLGSSMGLQVWAPKSDRHKSWDGKAIADIPNILANLPTNFDTITNEIVGNIDVIWMSQANAILAAFEVEHSTAIYSGLLRMSDLLTMQPNIDIKLFIVGPDGRFEKFRKELPRPTFAYRTKPLHKLCGFVPYSKLCDHLDAHKQVIRYLKPEFLDDITEYYDPEEEVDA